SSYAVKVAKAFVLLPLQHPLVYGLFSRVCVAANSSSGAVLRKMTRGFGSAGAAALLRAVRQQPCTPLLAMLAWRLTHEDGLRLARRKVAGERMLAGIAHLGGSGLTCIGHRQPLHSHWLVPVSVQNPDRLRTDLARAGFDAHGASNVVAIGGSRATSMVNGLVFLPCYPEMDVDARDRVAAVVRSHFTGHAEE
ncbi:MAG: hypothetical protein M3Q09_11310, partial [Gemmatimonadota bacterium]|nr:hypothetical protein [Gemmatimonadota bacterium]